MDTFIALLTSLPTGHSTTRMRVWRALKETGCGVLRDGVYVLPVAASQAAALAAVESEIRSAGGFAMTAELAFKAPAEIEHVRKLFDRGKEYAGLVARIGSAKTALSRLGERKADTLVQRLRRSLEELVAIDFYPGHAQLQAKQAVAALEGEKLRVCFRDGEPQASKRRVRRLDARSFATGPGPRARPRGWTASPAPGSSGGSSTQGAIRLDRQAPGSAEGRHRVRFRRRRVHPRRRSSDVRGAARASVWTRIRRSGGSPRSSISSTSAASRSKTPRGLRWF